MILTKVKMSKSKRYNVSKLKVRENVYGNIYFDKGDRTE